VGSVTFPPPDEGTSLLNEYLHDFNSRIPLFHPETIYNYVCDCYSGIADRAPLCWVLAYIALGIAHRLRAVSLFAVADDTTNADFYLNKCLAVLPDLLLQEPTHPLIQALLGVSTLLQTSDSSRKAPLFVSPQCAWHKILRTTKPAKAEMKDVREAIRRVTSSGLHSPWTRP
jgi:hypothetical protein